MEHIENYNCFFDVSKKIVADFIQSVVAVDDQMVFDIRPQLKDAGVLTPPDYDPLGADVSEDKHTPSLSAEHDHRLYYQDLSASFAKKGIICSGFKPLDDRGLTINSILQSSKNADITILDWQMDGAGKVGSLATDAIRQIIDSDIMEGGRLRLITIYTADNILDVLRGLEESLEERVPVRKGNYLTFSSNGLMFCKIDVISKEKPEEELTDEVIASFADLTAGLLSNAALASITDVRDRTHNILYKFNKNLDPAYLSHVLGLISSPDMREQAHNVAFDYAVEILSEEIKSELQTSAVVKKSLSRETITLWPKYVNSSNDKEYFKLLVGKLPEVRFDTSRMENLLSICSEEELIDVLNREPELASVLDKNSIDVFKKENIELSIGMEAASSHLELSAIQCVRRDLKTNSEHTPVLKQGTILKGPRNKYYVCIQPLCDSVRLKGATNFTFLKIIKVRSDKPFTHVVRALNDHLILCVRPSSKEINVFKFFPCDEVKVVKALREKEKYVFKEIASGKDFEWCGEFKQAVAQEIVNSVSASIARVGFDSFEWLRLKSMQ